MRRSTKSQKKHCTTSAANASWKRCTHATPTNRSRKINTAQTSKPATLIITFCRSKRQPITVPMMTQSSFYTSSKFYNGKKFLKIRLGSALVGSERLCLQSPNSDQQINKKNYNFFLHFSTSNLIFTSGWEASTSFFPGCGGR